jgi:hypothetical protein
MVMAHRGADFVCLYCPGQEMGNNIAYSATTMVTTKIPCRHLLVKEMFA